MDDSIFVDLVNALTNYEKEDKEKEQAKKGKDTLKEKDQKEDDKKDIEEKCEMRIENGKILTIPFPSMHIFNVTRLQICNNLKKFSLEQLVYNYYF